MQLFHHVNTVACGKQNVHDQPTSCYTLPLETRETGHIQSYKEQIKGEKQILIGRRASRIYWGLESVNERMALVNNCHL